MQYYVNTLHTGVMFCDEERDGGIVVFDERDCSYYIHKTTRVEHNRSESI
jgi:hypothetical protein